MERKVDIRKVKIQWDKPIKWQDDIVKPKLDRGRINTYLKENVKLSNAINSLREVSSLDSYNKSLSTKLKLNRDVLKSSTVSDCNRRIIVEKQLKFLPKIEERFDNDTGLLLSRKVLDYETIRLDNKYNKSMLLSDMIGDTKQKAIDIINKHRANKKQVTKFKNKFRTPTRYSIYQNLDYEVQGFVDRETNTSRGCVHVNAGDFLRADSLYQARICFEAGKRPDRTTDDRYLGIEFEFYSKASHEQLAIKIREANLHKQTTVKGDGSIRPEAGYIATEIAFLCKESELAEKLEVMLGIIKSFDGKVNESCGLHVHVDLHKRDKDIMFWNMVASQEIMYSLVAKHRHTSDYCKKRDKLLDKVPEEGNKYTSINTNTVKRYGTIEVRLHHGCLDFTKVYNWCMMLVSIANKANKTSGVINDVDVFFTEFNIGESLKEFILNRIKFFKENPTTKDVA